MIKNWQAYIESIPKDQTASDVPTNLFDFVELVLGKDNVLRPDKRFPGANKIGMLAWHVTMKTPQYPEGREVVIIANDVTVQVNFVYFNVGMI